MFLHIDDHKTIRELQDRFAKCFPHLEIVFYYHPQHFNRPADMNDQINAEKTVGEVSDKHVQGSLEIKSWDKAGKVENGLRKEFGLFARIFRCENKNLVHAAFNDKLAFSIKGLLQENTMDHCGSLAEKDE